MIKQSSDQQAERLGRDDGGDRALKVQLAELRAEKAKREELAEVTEHGAAKGRTYEEAVFEALDAVAVARGDDCDAVGDLRGQGGRKGDVLVAIDACAGPRAAGSSSRPRTASCRGTRRWRSSTARSRRAARTSACSSCPARTSCPPRTHPLREYNGDKLFVVYDPEDGSRLALEVAYGLARARC